MNRDTDGINMCISGAPIVPHEIATSAQLWRARTTDDGSLLARSTIMLTSTTTPEQAGLDAGARSGPRLLLADHHRAIELAGRELLASTYADDPPALYTAYRGFERAILDHLAAEETMILPQYEIHAPHDAKRTRDEHVEIRDLLFKVALEVELHLVRVERIEVLLEKLHDHAAREELAMYPWAQLHLPVTTKRELFVRIGHSLRSLAHWPKRH